MNDKELLELAAKAIGRKIERFDGDDTLILGVFFEDHNPNARSWNPLTNDGAALRLAAELKIDIEWQATRLGVMPEVEAYISNIDGESVCFAEDEQDYRLAIVAAAANLGRGMP